MSKAKPFNPLTMTDEELIKHCDKQVQALRMALEALGWTEAWRPQGLREEAITALRDALAEQPAQQEPVAWIDGATHYQPNQKAFYKRVSATEWYVWSRVEQEPLHWCKALGTSDSAHWILRQPAQQEPVATDWERIARVQDAKLRAMCNESGGFEKLCEVMDRYEHTSPQPAQQDSTCSNALRAQGKAYPRTCKKCGLGPCVELAQQALDKKAENARELGLDYEPVPENFMDALKFDVAMREWVGLTDEERDAMIGVTDLSGTYYYDDLYAVILLAEGKLKEKNARELGLDYEPEQKPIIKSYLKKDNSQPVKWSDYEPDGMHHNKRPQNCGTGYCSCIECVMEPAQRTWVGLTDEDLEAEFGFIDELLRDCCYRIEAKLKEKNT